MIYAKVFPPREISRRIHAKFGSEGAEETGLGSVNVVCQKQDTCHGIQEESHFKIVQNTAERELSRETVTVTGFASSPIYSTTSQNTNLK